jgi:iron complex transport system substrate-binding protein
MIEARVGETGRQIATPGTPRGRGSTRAAAGTLPAMRIVSLLPSATEILFALGVGDDVVGVTFECDWPPEARGRRIVSTTELPDGLTPGEIDAEVRRRVAAGEALYRLDEGALADLDPELIVTQDLCEVCALDVADVDAALAHLGCQADVLTLDPSRLDEVIASIVTVGERVGAASRAVELVASLTARLDTLAEAVAGRARPRMAVLEWTDPPYSSGHWVPDLVVAAGAAPVLGCPGDLSTAISWPEVAAAEADVVVVAPCGYRLDAAADFASRVVDAGVLPDGVAVWAADADAAFVRPGPRLVDGAEALGAIAHPDVVRARPDVAHRVR